VATAQAVATVPVATTAMISEASTRTAATTGTAAGTSAAVITPESEATSTIATTRMTAETSTAPLPPKFAEPAIVVTATVAAETPALVVTTKAAETADEATTVEAVEAARFLALTTPAGAAKPTANNTDGIKVISFWLPLDCTLVDFEVVVEDVYAGLATCGVARTQVARIVVQCGSTQVLVYATSQETAKTVESLVESHALEIATHDQVVNASRDVSTTARLLPETEAPPSPALSSTKRAAVSDVESSNADGSSSDSTHVTTGVTVGVLVCVFLLLLAAAVVHMRHKNKQPQAGPSSTTGMSPVACASSAQLFDDVASPAIVRAGTVARDSNNRPVLLLGDQELDHFKTAVRNPSSDDDDQYSAISPTTGFSRLMSVTRDNPLFAKEAERRRQNRGKLLAESCDGGLSIGTVPDSSAGMTFSGAEDGGDNRRASTFAGSTEADAATLRRSSHFFQEDDGNDGAMLRRRSLSYMQGVAETSFASVSAPDYAEIDEAPAGEPQYAPADGPTYVSLEEQQAAGNSVPDYACLPSNVGTTGSEVGNRRQGPTQWSRTSPTRRRTYDDESRLSGPCLSFFVVHSTLSHTRNQCPKKARRRSCSLLKSP